MTPARPGFSRRVLVSTALSAVAAPALGRAGPDGEAEGPRARAKADRTSARPALPPVPDLPDATRSGLVTVKGVAVFFAQYGAGKPVLLLHGGLGHSGFWANQVRSLADTHLVTAMDTRGHGRSPLTSKLFGYRAFADDAAAVLDFLEIRSAAIVGWSDGAIAGLVLAMTKPERVDRLFAFAANVTPAGLKGSGASQPAFASYLARCRADYATISPRPERWPDLVAGLRTLWRREPNLPWQKLAALRVPTVVAAAEHDEIIRPDHARRIAETIPGARLAVLNGVSHFAMIQDPAGFDAALGDFLAG